MGTELGPHMQMATLVRQAATKYEMDSNADLRELLNPVIEQIAAHLQFDNFDKPEYLNRIRGPLAMEASGVNRRRAEFLSEAVTAIEDLRTRL